MANKVRNCFFTLIMTIVTCFYFHTAAQAHEYSNLNEIMIDRANDSIYSSVMQVQSFLTEIFRRSYNPDKWPDVKLTVLRNDLMHQKEEANMSLDYFAANGVNIQTSEVLFDNPLAGRSMAASQAVETAFVLLKYINSLDSQDEFVKEIYSGGQSAHMYNLLTAYREKMDLYRAIFVNVPGPGQLSTQQEVAISETDSNESLIVPYLVGLLLFSILVIGMLLRKHSML